MGGNTAMFGTNTVVFGANTVVYGANTVVFGAYTAVFGGIYSVIWGEYSGIWGRYHDIGANTMAFWDIGFIKWDWYTQTNRGYLIDILSNLITPFTQDTSHLLDTRHMAYTTYKGKGQTY